MGTVLYECKYVLHSHAFIPLILLIAGICAMRIVPRKGCSRIFFAFYITFAAIIGLIVINGQINQYNKIVAAYQEGDYQIVEGYVENFHPMPAGGHDTEHFEIDGVYFEYSDFTVQQGYHNARSLGGVITGDGQHLRIGYIEMESSTGNGMLDNVIVYIEELP